MLPLVGLLIVVSWCIYLLYLVLFQFCFWFVYLVFVVFISVSSGFVCACLVSFAFAWVGVTYVGFTGWYTITLWPQWIVFGVGV